MEHTEHKTGTDAAEVGQISSFAQPHSAHPTAIRPKEVVNRQSWLDKPKRLAYRVSKVIFDGSGFALSALAKFNIEASHQNIDTTEIPIEIANLPEHLHGLRIAQISDLHFGSFLAHEGMERIIELTKSLRPDLILLTGDYVNRWVSEVKQVIPMLGRLEAPLGVYAVLGNHDFYADAEETMHLLSRHGIKYLDHDSESITVAGSRLWLLGSGDYNKDRRYDLNDRLARVPADEPKIVMAHSPDTADLPRSHRVDLMMCGHTHGGQIRLPGKGALLLPTYNRNYDQGLFRLGEMQLFVSRGVGMVGLPFRINCPPQLPILQLVPAGAVNPS